MVSGTMWIPTLERLTQQFFAVGNYVVLRSRYCFFKDVNIIMQRCCPSVL
jgi:hypothetical protein